MLWQWYRSVLKNYVEAPLTPLQLEILVRCVEIDPTVYDIKKNLERDIRQSRGMQFGCVAYMELPQKDEINYKLVHQGVKRLEKLGYVQKAKTGYLERGKIPYRHTELGVFFLLHNNIGHLKSFYHGKEEEEDVAQTLRVFLHPYFEFSTIKNATSTLVLLLHRYLQQCCVESVNLMRGEYHKYPKWTNHSELKRISVEDVRPVMEHLELANLSEELRITASSYFLKLMAKEPVFRELNVKIQGVDEDERRRNYEYLVADRKETINLLAKDKKFMEFLDVSYADVSKSYSRLMDLRRSF
jgi:hypothetical protein